MKISTKSSSTGSYQVRLRASEALLFMNEEGTIAILVSRGIRGKSDSEILEVVEKILQLAERELS